MEEKSDIQKLLEIIVPSRCSTGHHNEWVKVGQAIKNEVGDDGLHDFVTWTCQFGSANKKREASKQYSDYIHCRPENVEPRLSVKSLHYWAKQTDALAYDLAFTDPCDVSDYELVDMDFMDMNPNVGNSIQMKPSFTSSSDDTSFAKLIYFAERGFSNCCKNRSIE